MTTKSMVESAWAEDIGQFLYHVDHDTRKITSLDLLVQEVQPYSSTVIATTRKNSYFISGPVSWGCRIPQLHLCRGVRLPPPNECPEYNKQSDGETPVMLEIWKVQSTPFIANAPWSTLA